MAKSDCKGHEYIVNGHVARCKHCDKVQTYDPFNKKWNDAKK